MAGVIVARGKDLIKTKIRIDANGNQIDPNTKQVIKPLVESPFTPTPEQIAGAVKKTKETEEKVKEDPSNGLDAIIARKLGEKIGDAIGKALENMDLDKLIGDAVDKALKK